MKHLRGNAVAYLALFVALGGTSYAAVKLPANSVGPKQLKRHAVVGKKIAKNAVDARAIRNGSVKADDLAPGVFPSPSPAPAKAEVVHRVNVTDRQSTGKTGSPAVLAVSSFTQPPDAAIEIIGQINGGGTPSCPQIGTGGTTQGGASVQVLLDGRQIGYFQISQTQTGGTMYELNGSAPYIASGDGGQHELKLEVSDNCESGGVPIHSLRMDVISIR